jgi:hypothetical protein
VDGTIQWLYQVKLKREKEIKIKNINLKIDFNKIERI